VNWIDALALLTLNAVQPLHTLAYALTLVTLGGVLWGRPLVPQLALGASVAIGAVPEGLPLLAGVAQAAVARRLSSRKALVRRLAAVEALGRDWPVAGRWRGGLHRSLRDPVRRRGGEFLLPPAAPPRDLAALGRKRARRIPVRGQAAKGDHSQAEAGR